MLAVDADNAAALAVYRAFGMKDSGAIYEGRKVVKIVSVSHRFYILTKKEIRIVKEQSDAEHY